jgi:hypothetical protein
MKLYPFVVLADRLRGFDTLEEAKQFACEHAPCVICERRLNDDGVPQLVEILRHDYLYDEEHHEWRTTLG